jgi:hypothetical protein
MTLFELKEGKNQSKHRTAHAFRALARLHPEKGAPAHPWHRLHHLGEIDERLQAEIASLNIGERRNQENRELVLTAQGTKWQVTDFDGNGSGKEHSRVDFYPGSPGDTPMQVEQSIGFAVIHRMIEPG